MKPTAQPTPGPWWLVAGNGFVEVTTGPEGHAIAAVKTEDAEGVANVRAVVRVPEMIAALEAFVEAGAEIQAGERGGEVMGKVSNATDAARALLAWIRGEVGRDAVDAAARGEASP